MDQPVVWDQRGTPPLVLEEHPVALAVAGEVYDPGPVLVQRLEEVVGPHRPARPEHEAVAMIGRADHLLDGTRLLVDANPLSVHGVGGQEEDEGARVLRPAASALPRRGAAVADNAAGLDGHSPLGRHLGDRGPPQRSLSQERGEERFIDHAALFERGRQRRCHLQRGGPPVDGADERLATKVAGEDLELADREQLEQERAQRGRGVVHGHGEEPSGHREGRRRSADSRRVPPPALRAAVALRELLRASRCTVGKLLLAVVRARVTRRRDRGG